MKQGFLMNSGTIGTKVSVRLKQGGRSSEVVIKRGSTVFIFINFGYLYYNREESKLNFTNIPRNCPVY